MLKFQSICSRRIWNPIIGNLANNWYQYVQGFPRAMEKENHYEGYNSIYYGFTRCLKGTELSPSYQLFYCSDYLICIIFHWVLYCF